MPRYRTLLSNRIQSSSVLLFISLAALDTCPFLTPHVSVAISYYHWFILRPLYAPSTGAPPRAFVARKGLCRPKGLIQRVWPSHPTNPILFWDDASDICRNHLPDLIPICAPYPHISVASNQYTWCVRSFFRHIKDGFSKIRTPTESSLSIIYTRLHICLE